MKSLNQYIKEKLIINKDYIDVKMYRPKSFDELRNIIEDRYDKLGPGTKQKPIDFNDIDVSNLDSFCDRYKGGIFEKTKFKYIDITYWDVSNVYSMRNMFYDCGELESIGDISKWNVSSVTDMAYMFLDCKSFNQDISMLDVSKVIDMRFMFGDCDSFNQDLSDWNVSSVTNMYGMFYGCKSLNKGLSRWNVSSVTDMEAMFRGCSSFNQDLSKWNVSNVKFKGHAFDNCPIKDEYKPKF